GERDRASAADRRPSHGMGLSTLGVLGNDALRIAEMACRFASRSTGTRCDEPLGQGGGGMLHRWFFAVSVCCVTVAMAAPVGGAESLRGRAPGAADYAGTALNIIPSGQYGSVPPPPQAADQAQLYDGLTPLFGNVRTSDLSTYFKSERLGTSARVRCKRS